MENTVRGLQDKSGLLEKAFARQTEILGLLANKLADTIDAGTNVADSSSVIGNPSASCSTAVPSPTTPAAAAGGMVPSTPVKGKKKRKNKKKKTTTNMEVAPQAGVQLEHDISGAELLAKEVKTKQTVTFQIHSDSDDFSPREVGAQGSVGFSDFDALDEYDQQQSLAATAQSVLECGISTQEYQIHSEDDFPDSDIFDSLFEVIQNPTFQDEMVGVLSGNTSSFSFADLSLNVCVAFLKFLTGQADIEPVYLALQRACGKLGVDHLYIDTHFAIRESLSISLMDYVTDEDEGEQIAVETLLLGQEEFCARAVLLAIEAGRPASEQDAEDTSLEASIGSEDIYRSAENNGLKPNTVGIDPCSQLSPPIEPEEETSSDSDHETQVFHLREDGDVEIKSPAWCKANGYGQLSFGLFGCRTTWLKMKPIARERLAEEATDYVNGQGSEEAMPTLSSEELADFKSRGICGYCGGDLDNGLHNQGKCAIFNLSI